MKKKLSVLLSMMLVFSTVAFTACEKKDKLSSDEIEKIENIKLPQGKDKYVYLDVYFRSSKDEKNADIVKQEKLIEKEQMVGKLIMQELINGPAIKSNLVPVLPKKTRLLAFSIKDGIAYVNLSKEVNIDMTSVQEIACLKSIAKSLTQLPSINKIQMQVENHNIKSLGGNYDISKPFGEDEIDDRKI